jgi:hypothetical protein
VSQSELPELPAAADAGAAAVEAAPADGPGRGRRVNARRLRR